MRHEKPYMIACLRPLSALILVGLLTACATSSNSGLGELPRTPNASIEQLLQQASQSKPEEAALLRLSAADLAYQQKDLARSTAILGQIPLESLKPAQQVFASTLNAELALARSKPKAALQALQHPSMQHLSELPVTQQVRTQRAKAQALAADGQVLAAAKERIYFAPLLEGPAVIENQEKIWTLVSSLPVDQLQPSANEGDLSGWLTLARITKTSPTLQQQQASIESWQQQNPEHPAAKHLPAALEKLKTLSQQPLTRIALLLPQQGQLANVARALQDGFLAAHFQAQQAGQNPPSIKLYDSTQVRSLDDFYRPRPMASNWSSVHWRSRWSSNSLAASNCRSPPSHSTTATTARKARRSCSSSASPPRTKRARWPAGPGATACAGPWRWCRAANGATACWPPSARAGSPRAAA